jgi:uncharacterized membrane protein SpoIIM required for sporulation
MYIFFFVILQGLLIVGKVVFHIWQIVKNCSIDIKDIVYFVADILVNSFIYETKEHISLTRMISISKNNIRVALCLSKY